MREPAREKCPGVGFCSYVDHWNGFWLASESVNNCETVGVTLQLRKGTNNINMDAVESALGQCELVLRSCVVMNLGALTGSAGSYPSSNILVDAVLHKTLRDELLCGPDLLCGLNSWMNQVVDNVKNQAA